MDTTDLLTQLSRALTVDRISIDEKTKALYGRDLTQQHAPNPLAVVFPINEKELIEIVHFANRTNTALVPSGGRTGYSGGAIAAQKELVVSFEKMNRVINYNSHDKSITCEAGVTLKTIQQLAQKHHLLYPIDFASAETCQIGGNIATNAGGINVIRYGLTRHWVSGLKVLTGKGDLLNLNKGLIKNAAGYDLMQLFIGSEGTLGFITEVCVQLTTPALKTKTIFFSLSDKNQLIEVLNIFDKIAVINAFEFFSDDALKHVMENHDVVHPFSHQAAFYGLLEYESDQACDVLIEKNIKLLLNKKIIGDFLIAKDELQADTFWQYRKSISLSLKKHFPYKYDIAVLPSKISTFMTEAEKLFEMHCPKYQIIWFGHVGDGNLHLNILKPDALSRNKFLADCERISAEIYALIKKFHGAVSAEHGIGLLKKPFLSYSKTDIEINYMRHIKKIFDPNGIMNPGKIF